jgi:hypothetical protein
MLTIAIPVLCAGIGVGPVNEPVVSVFAAPRIIVLHGGSLEAPVYLTNWWDNLTLLLAAQNGRSWPSTSEAPAQEGVRVAMFWGNDSWDAYARNPTRLPELLNRLEESEQARLILTGDRRGAMMDYRGERRALQSSGLFILARNGVALPQVPDSGLARGLVERFQLALGNRDSATVRDLLSEARFFHGGVAVTPALGAANDPILRQLLPARHTIESVTVEGATATVRSTSRRQGGPNGVQAWSQVMHLTREDGQWHVGEVHLDGPE